MRDKRDDYESCHGMRWCRKQSARKEKRKMKTYEGELLDVHFF